jgi:hypothetical protein
VWRLPNGTVEIRVDRADMRWDDLFVVASRYNPRRGFIFVSKVLGKHWPVRPKAMAMVHGLLAGKLAVLGLEKPLVAIAMAETAVGLGRGIFDRYAEFRGTDGLLFLQTTRHLTGAPALLTADEPHCHARDHTVHVPEGDPEKARILAGARTLVLVDDEITTGETLKGLARAFVAGPGRGPGTAGPGAGGPPGSGGGVRRVVLCSIASFLAPEARAELASALPVPVSGASLLEGTFTFRKTGDMAPPGTFRSVGAGLPSPGTVPVERGRLGLLPGEGLPDLKATVAGLSLPPGVPVRVIGTGEFLHEPFLLARALEEEGRDVAFQSTTRTPIAPGGGIACSMRFEDNYGEGLDNFLYNAPASFPGETVVCRETAASPEGFDVAARLGAREIML